MGERLTKAQADVLRRMGEWPNSLVNADEYRPMWWVEGGFAVKRKVAQALIRRGHVKLTARAGGHPGVLYFTATRAGRAALAEQEGR